MDPRVAEGEESRHCLEFLNKSTNCAQEDGALRLNPPLKALCLNLIALRTSISTPTSGEAKDSNLLTPNFRIRAYNFLVNTCQVAPRPQNPTIAEAVTVTLGLVAFTRLTLSFILFLGHGALVKFFFLPQHLVMN